MSLTLNISILILNAVIISSNFLDAKSNYLKPNLERNNVVNKRVWVKNKNSVEKTGKGGQFVFGADSYDVEGGLVNEMDEAASNGVPFISTYADRSKRSTNLKRNTAAKIKQNHELIHNATADLKINDDISKTTVNNMLDKYTTDFENNSEKAAPNNSSRFQPQVIKKVEYDEELNRTFDEIIKANKIERDVFDKDDVWHQNPVMDTPNSYKLHKMPMPEKKSKPVTERGLLKILSLLTKTFKKIMRQHDDVKRIHGILQRLNEEFVQNIDLMTTKFNDFDIKYMYLLKMDENIRQFETKFKEREQDNKNKESDLAKNMIEFANQQKKFLAQQQQFYNVQKLILMQNEKITAKQNMIARSQSDISRKQNNFARILKQVKQIFVNKKMDAIKVKEPINHVTPPIMQPTKYITSTESFPGYQMNEVKNYTDTPLEPSTTTDPMKINLFSIVPMKSLENNDDQILKEKDEKPVDDLIYKYYFNNTFIDNLIKNKILANFIVSENNELVPENKNKREHLFARNNITFLFPVLSHLKTKALQSKRRQKRWIRHHPKSPRKHRGKETTTVSIKDDVKIINLRTKHSVEAAPLTNNYILPVTAKVIPDAKDGDPFRTMATNFCKEIGQNVNDQSLKWCVEKALRRLKSVDSRKQLLLQSNATPTTAQININTTTPTDTAAVNSSTTPPVTTSNTISTTVAPTLNVAFPDNEELESFLQQYELKPDIEGNVYYEGSFHASDIGPDPDSEGASDVMPSLDNHSKMDARRKLRFGRRPGVAKFF